MAAAVLGYCPHAHAQSATASGHARAEVVAPLVVLREADLAFGTIFAAGISGTVTVTTAGATNYAGGAQPACIAGACALPHPASFRVQGEPGRAYMITVPAEITADGTATAPAGPPAPPLAVTAITVRSDSRPGAGPAGQLDATGRDRFVLGGSLEMPPHLPSASYRATIPVVVTYG